MSERGKGRDWPGGFDVIRGASFRPNGRPPEASAGMLRELYRRLGVIPLTLRDACAPGNVSAHEAAFWVEQDAGCAWAEALAAVGAVLPELFADHWLREAECPPSGGGGPAASEDRQAAAAAS